MKRQALYPSRRNDTKDLGLRSYVKSQAKDKRYRKANPTEIKRRLYLELETLLQGMGSSLESTTGIKPPARVEHDITSRYKKSDAERDFIAGIRMLNKGQRKVWVTLKTQLNKLQAEHYAEEPY